MILFHDALQDTLRQTKDETAPPRAGMGGAEEFRNNPALQNFGQHRPPLVGEDSESEDENFT